MFKLKSTAIELSLTDLTSFSHIPYAYSLMELGK